MKPTKNQLQNFGITFFIILLHISLIPIWKGNLSGFYKVFFVADLFLFLGLLFPNTLKYVYIVWMKFGVGMNWVMTRIIMGIVLYLLIYPISLWRKRENKDLINEEWDKNAETYWNERKPVEDIKNYYERQF